MRDRARAERQGRLAEWLAGLFLQAKGYRVLARRFKAPGGEVDLVARKGDVLVFAEVKLRPNVEAAILAVDPRSRARIEAAGYAFIASRPRYGAFGVRYDILAVRGLRISHLRDAWRAARRWR